MSISLSEIVLWQYLQANIIWTVQLKLLWLFVILINELPPQLEGSDFRPKVSIGVSSGEMIFGKYRLSQFKAIGLHSHW